MSTVENIYNFIDKIAPFNTAADFDNSGLLVGDKDFTVNKCLVTLDITSKVVLEAKKLGVNLIISHHPVIFNPLKNLNSKNPVYLMAQNNISAICAHTNLDIAEKIGVNASLADALGILNIKTIENTCLFAMIGNLEQELAPKDLAKNVKEKLNCQAVKCYLGSKNIKTVAFCCGGGGEFIKDAALINADAFISSDVKHHEFLIAFENDITLIDAGHFNTENIVVDPLIDLLKRNFLDVEFIKSNENHDIVTFI